jgi:NitT/TauT family transport system permease protein
VKIAAFYARFERVFDVVLTLAFLLIVWELCSWLFQIRAFLLPAPTTVLAAFIADPRLYFVEAASTLLETLLGFGAAAVIGIVTAIGIVYSRFLERTLYTVLVTLNAIPKIALAPLFIVWLGTDLAPKVAIALLVAVFPIVIDTVLGLKSVDPDMLDLAKSLKGSRLRTLWKIRLPNALPSIFAGLKVGISFAFIGAIVGEFVASQSGLGYVVVSAQASFDTPKMFAAILLLALVGSVLFYAVEWIERLVIPWHVSHRQSESAGLMSRI